MNILNKTWETAYRMFTNPKQTYKSFIFYITLFLPDKLFLEYWFYKKLGYRIDFNNPQTFNEKLQWLKLYNRKSEYTQMVDKYAVKKYVADIIGEQYIIPTLGIWNSFDEIDFSKLPSQFVLKCTHDSGGIVLCKDKDKFDKTAAKKKIEKHLKTDFYKLGREWPYKNVPRYIIAERFLVDDSTNDLRDYKFFCFNGKVKFFKIDFDRFKCHKANYYSPNGTIQHFGEIVCPPDYSRKLNMPKNLNKMVELAELLAYDIPFLRVDFYEIEDNIYFGELTFFPASGFGAFTPKETDKMLGQLIQLENK